MLQIEKEHKRTNLMSSNKKELVEQIMYLEHNNNVLRDTLNQQAKNFNILTQQTWISTSERLPNKVEYETVIEGRKCLRRLEVAVQTDTIEYKILYFDGYKWFDKRQRIIDGNVVVAWKVHQPYQL